MRKARREERHSIRRCQIFRDKNNIAKYNNMLNIDKVRAKIHFLSYGFSYSGVTD